jgi:hypothetical protein
MIPKGLAILTDGPLNKVNSLKIGSPHWTRFELLLANSLRDRTRQRAMFSV